MEKSVQIFVLVNFIVIGLSHFFQANVWVDFFRKLSQKGFIGAYINGFISLSFGSIIVAFHWVWQELAPILITAMGVLQVIKSLIIFVFPTYGLKSISSKQAQNPDSYRIGGLLFLILAGIILLHLYQMEW